MGPAANNSFGAHAAFLRANSDAYEWLVGKIHGMDRWKKAEEVLDRVALAARFAAQFHPGRFADGAIENLALEIGTGLEKLVSDESDRVAPVVRQAGHRRRVLHVASRVLGIGGHTRMLYHWVKNDQSSRHSVLIVNQGDVPVPHWLSTAVHNSGGNFVVFPPELRLLQKARWLRETARRISDVVILHHDAEDVVPTVAFAVNECPPVAVLNHADHLFWLSSSVSDVVINLRSPGAELTMKRQFVSSNTILPIPLVVPVGEMSRHDARQALKIPDDRTVLLSIARGEKFRPCGQYDFVATASKILDRHPCAHFYVIGESPAGIAPYLRCQVHDRLHFVGRVEDPWLYRAAADVYLESFPFGSSTALLEAALSGLPTVPAYSPLFSLLVSNDDTLRDVVANPETEQEHLDRVDALIREPGQRAELGKALQTRLMVDHVGQGWLDRLATVYKETDCLTHRFQPIPKSSCSLTDADIGLSRWHIMADGRTTSLYGLENAETAELRHRAFVTKYVGNYKEARRYAWCAVLLRPNQWASWRLLATAILGPAVKYIRKALRDGQTKKGVMLSMRANA